MLPGTKHLPIIQRLLDEHVVIQDALHVLRVLTQRVEGRKSTDLADLRKLTKFFREYADNIHHRTEEDLLFVAVAKNGKLNSLSQKLLTQHTMGRIFVGEITDALKDASTGRRGWRQRFVQSATAYRTLLTIHICDENHIHFPLAEKFLAKKRTGMPTESSVDLKAKIRFERIVRRLTAKYAPTAKCDGCGSRAVCATHAEICR